MATPHVSLITDIHSKLFNENTLYSGAEIIRMKSLAGMAGSTCESIQVALAGRQLLGVGSDCGRRCQGALAR